MNAIFAFGDGKVVPERVQAHISPACDAGGTRAYGNDGPFSASNQLPIPSLTTKVASPPLNNSPIRIVGMSDQSPRIP
jgi:hypothetical protein